MTTDSQQILDRMREQIAAIKQALETIKARVATAIDLEDAVLACPNLYIKGQEYTSSHESTRLAGAIAASRAASEARSLANEKTAE